ncbi:hypothetical protein [Rhodococcus sp. MS16]|uniref:hypothetical protein n=1 Tax=Rhodococcus sp. MS16 TaxID=2579941 RepID=UPI001561DB1B|nr:hypothetical protein [Rhodococcus sp. MS16]
MNDDERDAWQMRCDGASWDQIGIEMGCSGAAAQSLATEYERRTDVAAQNAQDTLF